MTMKTTIGVIVFYPTIMQKLLIQTTIIGTILGTGNNNIEVLTTP